MLNSGYEELVQKYRHQLQYKKSASYYQHTRFVRRIKIAFIVIVLTLLGIVGYFVLDAYIQSRNAQTPSASTRPTYTTIAPSTNIFRTTYFQFQAPKDWVELSNDVNNSEELHFVYRNMDKNLIKGELHVYVNSQSQSLAANRALTVNVGPSGALLNPVVSESCLDSLPVGSRKRPATTVHDNISMFCDPVESNYTVIVGEEGGDTELLLSRPNGKEASYTIFYRNVTANPSANEFMSIVETFATR